VFVEEPQPANARGLSERPQTCTIDADYVAAVDWCWEYALMPDDSVRLAPGELYLGGTAEPVAESQG